MVTIRQLPKLAANRLLALGNEGVLVAFLVLGIVFLFVIPLTPRVLDVLIVLNIVVSLILLLRALFLEEAVDFFSFPSLLLVTTLYRLGLNVSSTRLILLRGDEGTDVAGHVIESFGNFVVRGDFFVGAIIFAVIAIVNFVVIAKGSARVAEVAARFTLDALPGKQLSIDSDLRSGALSKEDAHKLRESLVQESKFFGAMDGAMRFVQGDAIAGFVITCVNAIGGIILGISRPEPRRLSLSEAVNTFGILSIGDGLVSILPSLLISLCAGIVVTHVAGKSKRGTSGEIFAQILSEPRALLLAAVALLILSVIPGFPFLPFFVVGGVILLSVVGKASSGRVGSGYGIRPTAAGHLLGAGAERKRLAGAPGMLEWEAALDSSDRGVSDRADGYARHFGVHEIEIEADRNLVDPRSAENRGESGILRYAGEFKQKVFQKKGVILPEIVVTPIDTEVAGAYKIIIRGETVRSSQIDIGAICVLAPESLLRIFGVHIVSESRNPLDGTPAWWVSRKDPAMPALAHLGTRALNCGEFLVLEAVAAALDVIDEIFGLSEVKLLLKELEVSHPALIREVFEGRIISYPEFAELCRRLLREGVSIRDMKLILDGIAEFHSLKGIVEDRQDWLSELHGFLRVVLARSIIASSLSPGRQLRVFVLANEIEEEFRSVKGLWDHSRTKPPLEPEFEMNLRGRAEKVFGPAIERGMIPVVVLCSQDVRPVVQDFFRRHMLNPQVVRALAYEELNGKCRTEPVGVLHA